MQRHADGDRRDCRNAGLLLALMAATSVGCGRSSDTVSVRGQVTYRGEPMTNAAVTFFPATGRPVSAPLDDQGGYLARLAPGDYQVIVSVGVDLPPGYREGDPLPPPRVVLPPEYTTRAKSTLRATVSAGQAEPIDFEIP